MQTKVRTYINHHREEILAYLKSLSDINSYTGNPHGVNVVGDRVAQTLVAIGFSEKRHTRKTIGDHRYFGRPGFGGKNILFSCHLDTVFPPDLGFHECIVGDPITRGPGVIDMKGGITVLLHTLKMLDDLGLRRPSSYHIFFSSDEETGSEDARPLVEDIAKGKDYGLVFECGGSNHEVVSARKGVGTFWIDIEGRAAHAGNDWAHGIDANLEAAHKLIELRNLSDLDRGTTVNVGQISGGIGANTISPNSQLLIDIRFTHQEEGERTLEGLRRIARETFVPGSRATLRGGIQRPVMEETKGNRDFAARVHWLSEGTIHPEKRGGVGDANFIGFAGVPTLDGFGPVGGKDHTPEEFMITQSLFDRMELLARVLCELDGEETLR